MKNKKTNNYSYLTLLVLEYAIRKDYEKELKHLDKLCEKTTRGNRNESNTNT